MGKKTIYDVAKEAGVSISTVSRALNGTAKVKESTRRRIEAACVGYVPNAQARELQTHNVKTVGVIINHTPEYFFMNDTYVNALLGISVVARDKGYQLILNITDDEDVCDLYLENRVAGFIVMGVKKDGMLVSRLTANNIPFVVVGSCPDENIAQVDINDRRAMYMAAQYLIALGHERIGIITGSREYTSCSDRIDGYRDAMKENGLEVREEWVQSCDNITEMKAEQLAKNLFYQKQRVTAILAFNDSIALAVYKAAKDVGISIPKDLSVIGFDDTRVASYMTPMLTSVWQPSYEKGEKAMSVLINCLDKDKVPTGRTEFDCIIMYRESCARLENKDR